MFDLNDVELIQAADPHGMLGHIASLPQQLGDGWVAADAIDRDAVPKSLHQVDRVVVAGMGSSALSGSLWAALLAPECRLPISVVRDYDLPAHAYDANALVIAVSYSGNTEETLACFEQARQRGCRLIAITGGGQLRDTARTSGAPVISIDYAARRQASLGWTLAALLNIASRLGWVHDFTPEINTTTNILREWGGELAPTSPVTKNLAKREAGQLMGRSVVMFGAGLFAEVARRWKEQINETAKAWAALEVLPEADHNSLAGADWPDGATSKVMALFLTGQADHPRNAQRVQLTRQAYLMAGCNTDVLLARGETPLAQALSLVLLGDFMSFYLALLYGVDPALVPSVAEFKAALAAEG
jgi:glucose/mannose-6-phosphate isomerase